MIKVIRNILITLAATLAAIGCIKTSVPDKGQEGSPILLTAVEAGSPTKALLDKGTFSERGNSLKIYDHYTAGQSGSPATGYYIRDNATSDGNGTWPFSERHQWTTDGVHKFWGWLDKDVNFDPDMTASGFFGDGFKFNETTQILTIPETEMAPDSHQFDFMYSNIYTRNLNTTPDFSPIPLEFNHLFTAFRVTATNNSSNRIELRSVTISGLKNQRSATIKYSGSDTAPIVEYSNLASTEKKFTYNMEGYVLTPYNPESPIEPVSVSDGYCLMWPHTTTDFKGDASVPPAIVTVVYDYIELDANGNVTITQSNVSKDVKLDVVGNWLAGNKYDLNLVFMDKEIVLQCLVQDWIPMEEEIDFTEHVYASMPLTWDEDTVEEDNSSDGRVLLFSDEDITAVCRFKIDTPKGATWTASLIPLEGHPDAFAIVEGTKYGSVGLESVIKIKITNIDPISPRHACKLRITVQTADGRTIVVNNLMPEDTDKEITEYTIIQNLING